MSVLEASQIAIVKSIEELWIRFAGFLPLLIAAIVIFVIGWLVASIIGKLIEQLLRAIKLNEVLEKVPVFKSAASRANLRLDASKFVGAVIKWLLVIITLLATSDVLGLAGVSVFLNQVIAYIPNVVIAAVIVVAGIMFANFVQRSVKASIKAANISHAGTAAAVAKWVIWIFVFIATLTQLQILESIPGILLSGIIYMLTIAGGIAFGLGGKDLAAKILSHIEEDIADRNKR